VSLHIYVIIDCYARLFIFSALFSFKIMYVHSLACMTQTAVGEVCIIGSVVTPYLCFQNEQYLRLLITLL
jgi:hypothetical protein